MEVTVLGCGEAFDDQLPNTSLLVRGGQLWLLDCGYSVPPVFWRHVRDAAALDAIYISHAHADHYFGLPALLGRMWEEGRTKPLTVVSQREVLEKIRHSLELGYPGLAARFAFPLEFCPARLGGVLQVGETQLNFAETKHAVPNLAVRLESGGRVLCYSGDGMFLEDTCSLYAGAHLVVHEAFCLEPNPVHADIPSLVKLGLPRLAMVHVQRSLRRDAQRLSAWVDGRTVLLPEPGEQLAV